MGLAGQRRARRGTGQREVLGRLLERRLLMRRQTVLGTWAYLLTNAGAARATAGSDLVFRHGYDLSLLDAHRRRSSSRTCSSRISRANSGQPACAVRSGRSCSRRVVSCCRRMHCAGTRTRPNGSRPSSYGHCTSTCRQRRGACARPAPGCSYSGQPSWCASSRRPYDDDEGGASVQNPRYGRPQKHLFDALDKLTSSRRPVTKKAPPQMSLTCGRMQFGVSPMRCCAVHCSASPSGAPGQSASCLPRWRVSRFASPVSASTRLTSTCGRCWFTWHACSRWATGSTSRPTPCSRHWAAAPASHSTSSWPTRLSGCGPARRNFVDR